MLLRLLTRVLPTAFFLMVWLLQSGASATQSADRRVALVIGNSAYSSVTPLKNARGDAEAVARKLRDLGYVTEAALDLGYDALRSQIDRFLSLASGASAAVVYYAGRGLHLGKENMFVPVDFDPAGDLGKTPRLVSVSSLLAGLVPIVPTRILMLDARHAGGHDLFAEQVRALAAGTSAVGIGYIYSDVQPGGFHVFASAAGETGSDGDGAHGPFAAALLKHIDTRDLDFDQIVKLIRKDVLHETRVGGALRQVPYSSSTIFEAFYLAGRSAPNLKPSRPAGNSQSSGRSPAPKSASRGEGGVSFGPANLGAGIGAGF